MIRLKATTKQRLACNDGATAVEFALIAPIFFLLLMGIIELGLILFASSVMENAATMAARYGITGDNYSQAGGEKNIFQKNAAGASRKEFITKTIYDLSLGLLDPKNVVIDNKVIKSFAGAQNVGKGSGESYGSSGDGVIYYITYRWSIFTPFVGHFFKDGIYEVKSSVLVANEQY